MNKMARDAYERYNYSNMYSIFDAYKRPSSKKYVAWEYCKELKEKYGGRGLKVIGRTCQHFSAGFTFEKEGKKMFMYITPSADREYEVEA